MSQVVYSARERPFAVPGRLDELADGRLTGFVTLPTHIEWSHQRRYDLSRRGDRLRLYEQVLREGTIEDVRAYIDVDQLIDLWDEMFLPHQIKRAWADLLADERGLHLQC